MKLYNCAHNYIISATLTFDLVHHREEVEKKYIPHVKALIDMCLEPEMQGRGRTYTLCHALAAFRMENRVCAFRFFKHSTSF